MKRQTFIRSSLVAAAVLALAGCGHMHGSSSSSSDYGSAGSNALIETYTATLSPGDEVPPAANSKGTGTAEVRLDIRTNEFTYKVSWSGLTGPATMAHIHGPAAKGANAGVVVPFPDAPGKTATEGKGKLTQAQYGDLAAGLYYVNVHSAQYPAGEVRGQLMKK